MKTRIVMLLVPASLLFALMSVRFTLQAQRTFAVRPAKVEAMQNLQMGSSESGRPVYLPSDWGHLVSVQKIDADAYQLFLANNNGEIYLVRLIQRGQYLYLDTYDQGGVALVIRRNP